MLIRQSKNSFIRFYDDLGYITNQLTAKTRLYAESGFDFLKQINRSATDLEDIVDALYDVFDIDDKDTIRNDFLEFAQDLAANKFILIGDTTEELDTNELEFNYASNASNSHYSSEEVFQQTYDDYANATQEKLFELKTLRLLSIQIEITSRCNERCIHCYIPNEIKNKGRDLTFDKFKHIIDQFVKMGGIKIALSGGEALINKDLIRMLRYCREKDLQISLLTNLISLTDEHVEVLKEVNVSLVKVSLYSMSPNIHDEITTIKGSFIRTKDAIEKLHSANIRCEISCPLLKKNRESFDEVAKYAKSMNMRCATEYMIMAQSNFDSTNLSNRLSKQDAEIAIKDIIKNDAFFFKSVFSPLEDNSDLPFCSAGINALGISVDGTVLPCPGWDKYVVGNVFRQSLDDIFYNSRRLNNLRQINRNSLPKCLTCEARAFCDICLLRNYNESGGDMLKINQYFCDIAFLAKKIVYNYLQGNILIKLKNSPIYNLSLSSKELFHSNFLAWLGNNPTTKCYFAQVLNKLVPGLNLKIDGNWIVEREDKHFDLCIKEEGQYLLVIENKVKSIPDKKQLDNYLSKSIQGNPQFLLLTLVDDYPNKCSIIAQNKWIIRTYGNLARIMNSFLPNSFSNDYERHLLEDYLTFISELDKLQKIWQKTSYFIPNTPHGYEKLSDLYEKIKYSCYAIILQNRIRQIGNHIVVFDSSTEVQLNSPSRNKIYIKVGWGYTNNKGLVDIAIPVADLAKPQIIKGVVDPLYVVKIQVQGGIYRHVIETFDKTPVDKSLINIGRSSEYINQRQFFTTDPLDTKLPIPNYGNPNIFENKIYPINKGYGKRQIHPDHWPFASYKNKNHEVSFIYQYRKISPNALVNDVLDNIVNEVIRFISIFK